MAINSEPVRHDGIRRIVGRLHVNTPILEVIREVMSCMKGGRKTVLGDSAKCRYLIAATIQHHAMNLHEYRYVIGSVPRKHTKFRFRYFFNKDNKKVTIQ